MTGPHIIGNIYNIMLQNVNCSEKLVSDMNWATEKTTAATKK